MATYTLGLTLLTHLSAYCLAGSLMEHFTLFHAWSLTTTPKELQRIQTPPGMSALYVYVIPKAVMTGLAGYLVWTGGETWLKVAVAFMAVSWISSFTVQIPLQREIQRTGSREAVERLVLTDWVRVGAMVGHCCVVWWGVFMV